MPLETLLVIFWHARNKLASLCVSGMKIVFYKGTPRAFNLYAFILSPQSLSSIWYSDPSLIHSHLNALRLVRILWKPYTIESCFDQLHGEMDMLWNHKRKSCSSILIGDMRIPRVVGSWNICQLQKSYTWLSTYMVCRNFILSTW